VANVRLFPNGGLTACHTCHTENLSLMALANKRYLANSEDVQCTNSRLGHNLDTVHLIPDPNIHNTMDRPDRTQLHRRSFLLLLHRVH